MTVRGGEGCYRGSRGGGSRGREVDEATAVQDAKNEAKRNRD